MFVLTWGTRSSASTGSHCHLHSWIPWQWHGILMSRNAFERSLKKCIYGTVIRWIRRTWVSACGTYYFRLLPQHWSKNLRPLQAHQEQWSSPTNEGNEESIVKNASKTKQHVAVHGLLTQSEVPILGALFFKNSFSSWNGPSRGTVVRWHVRLFYWFLWVLYGLFSLLAVLK